jgi:cytochrome P450
MPPLVLTTDGDAVKRLLQGDPLTRHHANDAVRPLLDDRSVMLLEPAEHIERRKLLLPSFRADRVLGYGRLMRELMEDEVGRWRPGAPVAVLPIAQSITIEVILQVVLGVSDRATKVRFRGLIDDLLFYPLGSLRLRVAGSLARFGPSGHRARQALAFASSLASPAVSVYFPELSVRSGLNLLTRRWWRHHDRLLALLAEQIEATRADPTLTDRDDVLAGLVQVRSPTGRGLTTEELQNDLLTLIAAGHETTAAAIAWGAALLAHDPAVQDRAAAATMEPDDPYLGALVKEVLRLRPPLPVAAGRTLDEPFAIGDFVVPAGTPILIDAWGLHHDPARHREPDRFRPERFLDDPPEPYSWLPFGGGAHRCIGAGLAELEIRIALATMLTRASILPADAGLAPIARRGLIFVPQGGGRIEVGPRARPASADERDGPLDARFDG